jgi:hypothetical protein
MPTIGFECMFPQVGDKNNARSANHLEQTIRMDGR